MVYGGNSLFFLQYFDIFLEKLWYYEFWTQKLQLLTKFACNITVLNTPNALPPPPLLSYLHFNYCLSQTFSKLY